MSRADAIILMGPTGSGKTPLGALCEERSLRGRRCIHFDFGAILRAAAGGGAAGEVLSSADLAVVRNSLKTGALLEDKHFHIARALLRGSITARGPGRGDLLVLNGLPRHEGQARDLDPEIRVEELVLLSCDADVVRARIASDAGGDRRGRADDSVEGIATKLAIFEERTAPLLAHYRSRGARVFTLVVGPKDSGEDLYRQLNEGARGGDG
ncbi:MAG: nucleoside monophosphate kinase [Planctomycetota bacterium]|jgi:adenylate kinase family enzyme